MHKVYIQEYYPPWDKIIFGSFTLNCVGVILYHLPKGMEYWMIPLAAAALFLFIKLLSTFHVTNELSYYITADQKGIIIKRPFFSKSKFSWEEIEHLEFGAEKILLTHAGKRKSFYYSSVADNQKDLINLFKTIAPERIRTVIH